MGLLKCVERDDFATAARYLQPPPGEDKNLTQRAKELRSDPRKVQGQHRPVEQRS